MSHRRKDSSSIATEFGARLRLVREKRGFTQIKLAQAIGAYASQVSKYETGEVMPEGETLATLAEVLDVSLDELVLGRAADRPDDVRNARLRASVRHLEELQDRRLLDVAITVIDGLVSSETRPASPQRK